MPYVHVTDELIQLVKEHRKNNKISGEKLANAVDRSRVFISQFENGKMQLIDMDLLKKILKVATQITDENRFNEFIENYLKINPETAEQQEWKFLFDLQLRTFIIPDNLVEFIKCKCETLNLTSEKLVEEINRNKDLELPEIYEPNRVKIILGNNSYGWVIRFDLPEDYINNILNRKIKRANYVNLVGILYNIFLLEGFEKEEANKEAEQLLETNQIITILKRDKKKKANIKKNLETGEPIIPESVEVTEHDKLFAKAYIKTNSWFKHLNNIRPDEAYEYILQLNKSLDADWDFMFAILKLPFDKLKPLPQSDKKKFYNDLKQLIDKYVSEMGESEKEMDEYI